LDITSKIYFLGALESLVGEESVLEFFAFHSTQQKSQNLEKCGECEFARVLGILRDLPRMQIRSANGSVRPFSQATNQRLAPVATAA